MRTQTYTIKEFMSGKHREEVHYKLLGMELNDIRGIAVTVINITLMAQLLPMIGNILIETTDGII